MKEESKLYLTDPSGQVTMWKAEAIGQNSDKVLEFWKKNIKIICLKMKY